MAAGAVIQALSSIADHIISADENRKALHAQIDEWKRQLLFQQQQLGAKTEGFEEGTPVGMAWYTGSWEPEQFKYASSIYDALKRSPEAMAASYTGIRDKLFEPSMANIVAALGGGGEAARLGYLEPVTAARTAAAQTYQQNIADSLRAQQQAAGAKATAQGYSGSGTMLSRALASLGYNANVAGSQALAGANLQNAQDVANAKMQAYLERLNTSQNAASYANNLAALQALPAYGAAQEFAQLYSIPRTVSATKANFQGPQAMNLSGYLNQPNIATGISQAAGNLSAYYQNRQTQNMLQNYLNNSYQNSYQNSYNPSQTTEDWARTYGMYGSSGDSSAG